MTILLQRQRAYALEKIMQYSPNRALVFTYPCGWHGDVLFIAPYLVIVGPFEGSTLIDQVASLSDRVALIMLEGSWTAEDVSREFGPFDIGVACLGTPISNARRYVQKMFIINIKGPIGELLESIYQPADVEADVVIETE